MINNMENITEILQTTAITIGIASVFITPLVAYFRNKFNCIQKLKEDFDEFKDTYGDRQLRHSKAFIILANRLDAINETQHGKQLNLGPEIETILKDENGKL